MSKFFSFSNRPKTIAHPTTSKIDPIYQEQIDKDGKKMLKEVGQTNRYEKIQTFKEETMIYNILKRFAAGDVEALNQKKGTFGDFSNTPTSLAEAQQQLIDAENTFNSLPLEIRGEFDHSYEQFLASAQKGDVLDRIAKVERKFNKQYETKAQNNVLNGQMSNIEKTIQQETQKAVEVPTQPIETQPTGGIKYE